MTETRISSYPDTIVFFLAYNAPLLFVMKSFFLNIKKKPFQVIFILKLKYLFEKIVLFNSFEN